MINQNLSLGERLAAPTPKFFRKLRTVGLIIGGIGTALLAAPVALPAVVGTIAGYLLTAGTVVAAVTSTTVDYNALERSGR